MYLAEILVPEVGQSEAEAEAGTETEIETKTETEIETKTEAETEAEIETEAEKQCKGAESKVGMNARSEARLLWMMRFCWSEYGRDLQMGWEQ